MSRVEHIPSGIIDTNKVDQAQRGKIWEWREWNVPFMQHSSPSDLQVVHLVVAALET